MSNKHKTRTVIPRPTDNKTLSIGILLFVDAVYEKLGLERVFSPLKERGVDPNTLVRMLVAYKLVENNSISKAATWAAQPHIRDHYGVGPVSDQTFYRFLERMGPWLDLVMDAFHHYVGILSQALKRQVERLAVDGHKPVPLAHARRVHPVGSTGDMDTLSDRLQPTSADTSVVMSCPLALSGEKTASRPSFSKK